ncbi:hypothetical protein [Corynebacterium diphtheriae]|uniref:hypothetical protein n=1 Tax=Corynebacterium diphtheriae TaxID=1717 RepID=UPI002163E826|nr:hypothetical protein [Corynebacterium diphtheriae]
MLDIVGLSSSSFYYHLKDLNSPIKTCRTDQGGNHNRRGFWIQLWISSRMDPAEETGYQGQ